MHTYCPNTKTIALKSTHQKDVPWINQRCVYAVIFVALQPLYRPREHV